MMDVQLTDADLGRRVRLRDGRVCTLKQNITGYASKAYPYVAYTEVRPNGRWSRHDNVDYRFDVVAFVDEGIRLTDADLGRKVRLRDGTVDVLERTSNEKWKATHPYTVDGCSVRPDGSWSRHDNVESELDVVAFVDEPIAPKPKALQNVLRKLPERPEDRKTCPIVTGVLDYFPLALAEVARISKAGNDQHNPGQPLHWARHKSSDHADCIARHLVERGTRDSDGQRHAAKAAWRALALLQEELEQEAGWEPAKEE